MAFSSIQPLRLLSNDTAAGVFPAFNLSGNPDWKGNVRKRINFDDISLFVTIPLISSFFPFPLQANPVIPDTTWGYLLAAYAVLIAVKEGMQGIGGLASSRPILVLVVNALAAIIFSFVLIILSLMM